MKFARSAMFTARNSLFAPLMRGCGLFKPRNVGRTLGLVLGASSAIFLAASEGHASPFFTQHVFTTPGTGYHPFSALALDPTNSNLLWGTTNIGAGGGFTGNTGGLYVYNKQTDTLTLAMALPGPAAAPYPKDELIILQYPIKRSVHKIVFGTRFSAYNSNGYVFRYDVTTAVGSIVHNFNSGPPDGVGPAGPLALVNPYTIVGTTEGGGAANHGSIYSVTVYNGAYQQLYSFGANGGMADGYVPSGLTAVPGSSKVYGITEQGGPNPNTSGEVYSFDTSTNIKQPLCTFPVGQDRPWAGLAVSPSQIGNIIYGETRANDWYYQSQFGTIYSCTEATGTYNPVLTFDGFNIPAWGWDPRYGVFLHNGLLYGQTLHQNCCVVNCSNLWSLDPANPAGTFTVLHSLTQTEGCISLGMVPDGVVFYGTTATGGTNGGTNSPGTIFGTIP